MALKEHQMVSSFCGLLTVMEQKQFPKEHPLYSNDGRQSLIASLKTYIYGANGLVTLRSLDDTGFTIYEVSFDNYSSNQGTRTVPRVIVICPCGEEVQALALQEDGSLRPIDGSVCEDLEVRGWMDWEEEA